MEKLKILLVDDEPFILDSLTQLLEDDYDIYSALDGEKALKILEQNTDIAILVSDQRMPGLKGVDVLRHAKKISPNTIRILLTGYSDVDAIVGSVNEGEVFQYMRKPWTEGLLKNILSIAVTAYMLFPAEKTAETKITTNSNKNERFEKLKNDNSQVPDAGAMIRPFDEAFCDAEGKPKIMIVDDDENVLKGLKEMLWESYHVLTCKSAEDALEVLKKDGFVALILSDQRMPRKSGTDFLIESQQVAPLVPKILMTAYLDVEEIIRLVNEGQVFRYLEKPWNPEKLMTVLADAVATCKSKVQVEIEEKKLIVDMEKSSELALHEGKISKLDTPIKSGWEKLKILGVLRQQKQLKV